MIHRWIHRRALLAWLLLPWLAMLLAVVGMVAIDLTLGDGVSMQDWYLRPHADWFWQALGELPLLLAGLYGCGTVAWTLGVLMGGRPARRSLLALGLLCGAAGLASGSLIGFSWYHPTSLLLGAVALFTGGLYAALTQRPRLRVQRRLPQSVPVLSPPPIHAPPLRPPLPAPVPTLIRHEPPTTQPVEY